MSQEKFTRGFGTSIFLASAAGASHVLTGFASAPTGALRVYKPTVQCVASHSLVLDIQVVSLLSGEFSLFFCTCKSLLPHYQGMTLFLYNIRSTLTCVYTYNEMQETLYRRGCSVGHSTKTYWSNLPSHQKHWLYYSAQKCTLGKTFEHLCLNIYVNKWASPSVHRSEVPATFILKCCSF